MDDLSLALDLINRYMPGVAQQFHPAYNRSPDQPTEHQPILRKIPPTHKLLQGFVDDCTVRGQNSDSIITYKGYVKGFLEHFPHPETVSQTDLKYFLKILRDRNLKIKTQKSLFSALNTFYRYLLFEEFVTYNPIPSFRERYLVSKNYDSETRRLLTVEEVREILAHTETILQYSFFMLLAKTGMRRGEALSLRLTDIDFVNKIIHVPFKAKRSRNILFMDDELKDVLLLYFEWRKEKIKYRKSQILRVNKPTHKSADKRGLTDALFVGNHGRPLKKDYPNKWLSEICTPLGIHKQNGLLHEKVTCHCFRHFFTTYLRRAGMKTEHIQWLRGDAISDSWEIYNHIDQKVVRMEYCSSVPSLLVIPVTDHV